MVFDASFERFAEADLVTDLDPVVLLEVFHFTESGFAEIFEIIIPNTGDSEVVIIPEFAFLLGAVGGDGRVAGMNRVRFTIFIKKIRETDFDEDVVLFDILMEFVFVLDDGVFKGDAVRADEIGVNDEEVFGIWITDSHFGIPDFFGIGDFPWSHAEGDGGD